MKKHIEICRPNPDVKSPRMILVNEGYIPWKKFRIEKLQKWLNKRGCYLDKDGVVVDHSGHVVKP